MYLYKQRISFKLNSDGQSRPRNNQCSKTLSVINSKLDENLFSLVSSNIILTRR